MSKLHLETTGNESGDYVRKTQVMGDKEGFSAVNKSWLDKCLTFDQFKDKIVDARRERHDINITPAAIRVDINEGQLVVKHNDGRIWNPTEHCFKHLCNWLDVSQTMFKWYTTEGKYGERDNSDLELLKTAFELGRKRIQQDKVFLFRTYTDNTLRAMLSDRYDVVDNLWFIEQLEQLIPGGRISHDRYSDADTITCNVLIPDTIRDGGDASDYGGMVAIRNCEIGTQRLKEIPSIFRSICFNGCLHQQKEGSNITKVHRGIDLDDLKKLIAENINTQIPLLPELINKFLATRELKTTTKMSNIIAQLGLDYKWTPKLAGSALRQFADFEKENMNAFGLIGGLTRAGQLFDRETWLAMDGIGGTIMSYSKNEWERLNVRANALDRKTIEKVFAIAS